jgi:hypothetical protein
VTTDELRRYQFGQCRRESCGMPRLATGELCAWCEREAANAVAAVEAMKRAREGQR